MQTLTIYREYPNNSPVDVCVDQAMTPDDVIPMLRIQEANVKVNKYGLMIMNRHKKIYWLNKDTPFPKIIINKDDIIFAQPYVKVIEVSIPNGEKKDINCRMNVPAYKIIEKCCGNFGIWPPEVWGGYIDTQIGRNLIIPSKTIAEQDPLISKMELRQVVFSPELSHDIAYPLKVYLSQYRQMIIKKEFILTHNDLKFVSAYKWFIDKEMIVSFKSSIKCDIEEYKEIVSLQGFGSSRFVIRFHSTEEKKKLSDQLPRVFSVTPNSVAIYKINSNDPFCVRSLASIYGFSYYGPYLKIFFDPKCKRAWYIMSRQSEEIMNVLKMTLKRITFIPKPERQSNHTAFSSFLSETSANASCITETDEEELKKSLIKTASTSFRRYARRSISGNMEVNTVRGMYGFNSILNDISVFSTDADETKIEQIKTLNENLSSPNKSLESEKIVQEIEESLSCLETIIPESMDVDEGNKDESSSANQKEREEVATLDCDLQNCSPIKAKVKPMINTDDHDCFSNYDELNENKSYTTYQNEECKTYRNTKTIIESSQETVVNSHREECIVSNHHESSVEEGKERINIEITTNNQYKNDKRKKRKPRVDNHKEIVINNYTGKCKKNRRKVRNITEAGKHASDSTSVDNDDNSSVSSLTLYSTSDGSGSSLGEMTEEETYGEIIEIKENSDKVIQTDDDDNNSNNGGEGAVNNRKLEKSSDDECQEEEMNSDSSIIINHYPPYLQDDSNHIKIPIPNIDLIDAARVGSEFIRHTDPVYHIPSAKIKKLITNIQTPVIHAPSSRIAPSPDSPKSPNVVIMETPITPVKKKEISGFTTPNRAKARRTILDSSSCSDEGNSVADCDNSNIHEEKAEEESEGEDMKSVSCTSKGEESESVIDNKASNSCDIKEKYESSTVNKSNNREERNVEHNSHSEAGYEQNDNIITEETLETSSKASSFIVEWEKTGSHVHSDNNVQNASIAKTITNNRYYNDGKESNNQTSITHDNSEVKAYSKNITKQDSMFSHNNDSIERSDDSLLKCIEHAKPSLDTKHCEGDINQSKFTSTFSNLESSAINTTSEGAKTGDKESINHMKIRMSETDVDSKGIISNNNDHIDVKVVNENAINHVTNVYNSNEVTFHHSIKESTYQNEIDIQQVCVETKDTKYLDVINNVNVENHTYQRNEINHKTSLSDKRVNETKKINICENEQNTTEKIHQHNEENYSLNKDDEIMRNMHIHQETINQPPTNNGGTINNTSQSYMCNSQSNSMYNYQQVYPNNTIYTNTQYPGMIPPYQNFVPTVGQLQITPQYIQQPIIVPQYIPQGLQGIVQGGGISSGVSINLNIDNSNNKNCGRKSKKRDSNSDSSESSCTEETRRPKRNNKRNKNDVSDCRKYSVFDNEEKANLSSIPLNTLLNKLEELLMNTEKRMEEGDNISEEKDLIKNIIIEFEARKKHITNKESLEKIKDSLTEIVSTKNIQYKQIILISQNIYSSIKELKGNEHITSNENLHSSSLSISSIVNEDDESKQHNENDTTVDDLISTLEKTGDVIIQNQD